VLLLLSPQAQRLRRVVQDADRRKQQRRIQHSAPGAVKVKTDRKKKIVAELE
jgi:WD repeat and SOF domain-containing protein 1